MTSQLSRRRATIVRWTLFAVLLPLLAGLFWIAWQFDPPIWDLAISSDEAELTALCGSIDPLTGNLSSTSVHVWDPSSGRRVRSLSIKPTGDNLRLSADGQILGVVNDDGWLRVIDTRTFATIAQWHDPSPAKARRIVLVSQTGDSITCWARNDSSAQLDCWNVKTREKNTLVLPGERRWSDSAAAAQCIVVGWSEKGSTPKKFYASVYRVSHGELHEIADLSTLNPGYVQLSPDGANAVVHQGGIASTYDLEQKTLRSTVQPLTPPISLMTVKFRPDGRQFAYLGNPGTLTVWDAESGKIVSRIVLARFSSAATSWNTYTVHRNKLFAGGYNGVVSVWEMPSGKLLKRFPDHRSFLYGLIGAAGLWAVAWVTSGTRLDRARPALDVMLLNALLLGPLLLHTLRSLSRLDVTTYRHSLVLAHLASLAALLIVWWIHGNLRWSVRLAGLVAGLASLVGILVLMSGYEWAAWSIVVGAVSFISLLVGLFLLQRRMGLGVRRTKVVTNSSEKWQWPLRDTFLLVTAVAIFVGLARFLKPQSMPTWGITFVLSNGATLSITAFIASWAALGKTRWWLRVALLLVVAAGLGLGLPAVFTGLPIFVTLWYLNQHFMCAAIVFTSLLIFRLNGYRLEKV